MDKVRNNFENNKNNYENTKNDKIESRINVEIDSNINLENDEKNNIKEDFDKILEDNIDLNKSAFKIEKIDNAVEDDIDLEKPNEDEKHEIDEEDKVEKVIQEENKGIRKETDKEVEDGSEEFEKIEGETEIETDSIVRTEEGIKKNKEETEGVEKIERISETAKENEGTVKGIEEGVEDNKETKETKKMIEKEIKGTKVNHEGTEKTEVINKMKEEIEGTEKGIEEKVEDNKETEETKKTIEKEIKETKENHEGTEKTEVINKMEEEIEGTENDIEEEVDDNKETEETTEIEIKETKEEDEGPEKHEKIDKKEGKIEGTEKGIEEEIEDNIETEGNEKITEEVIKEGEKDTKESNGNERIEETEEAVEGSDKTVKEADTKTEETEKIRKETIEVKEEIDNEIGLIEKSEKSEKKTDSLLRKRELDDYANEYNELDEKNKRQLQDNAYFEYINNLDKSVNDDNYIKRLDDFTSEELDKMAKENPALFDYLERQKQEEYEIGEIVETKLESMDNEERVSVIASRRETYYTSDSQEQKRLQKIAYQEFLHSGKGITENGSYKTFENMSREELAKISEENPALLDYLNNEYQATHDARVLPNYANNQGKDEWLNKKELPAENEKGSVSLRELQNLDIKKRKYLLAKYLIDNQNSLINPQTNDYKTLNDYSQNEITDIQTNSPVYYAYLKGDINIKGEWVGKETDNVSINEIEIANTFTEIDNEYISENVKSREVSDITVPDEYTLKVDKNLKKDYSTEEMSADKNIVDLSNLSKKEIKKKIREYLMDVKNLNKENRLKTILDYSVDELDKMKNDNPVIYSYLKGEIDVNGNIIEQVDVVDEINEEIDKKSDERVDKIVIPDNKTINNIDSFDNLNLNIDLEKTIVKNPLKYENALNKYYRNINNYDNKTRKYKNLLDYSLEEQRTLYNEDNVLYYALANEYKKNNPDYEFPVYSDVAREKRISAIKEEVEKLTIGEDNTNSLDGKRLVNVGLDKISGKLENIEDALEDNEINLIIAKAEGLTIDKYYAGENMAKEYKELSLYTDHGIEHVKKVAHKSIEISKVFKACDYDYNITKQDQKELIIAAMYHDTGMDGKWAADSISDDTVLNGNHIRKDHPINSALHILNEREKLKASFNIDDKQVNNVAMFCLMHSKSASGVRNIFSRRQWAEAINKLYYRSEKAGIKCDINDFDIIKDKAVIRRNEEGRIVVKPADIDWDKLNKYAIIAGCLRIGDANAVDHPTSQAGENIIIERCESGIASPVNLYRECENNKVYYNDKEVHFDSSANSLENENALNSKMYNLGENNIDTAVRVKEINDEKILEEVVIVKDGLSAPGATIRCINERFDELDSLRSIQTAFTVEIHGDYTPDEKEWIKQVYKYGIKAHKASIGRAVKYNQPNRMKAVKSRSSIIDNVVFVED